MNSCEHVHHEESVSAKLGILSCIQHELSERKSHSHWGATVRDVAVAEMGTGT